MAAVDALNLSCPKEVPRSIWLRGIFPFAKNLTLPEKYGKLILLILIVFLKRKETLKC